MFGLDALFGGVTGGSGKTTALGADTVTIDTGPVGGGSWNVMGGGGSGGLSLPVLALGGLLLILALRGRR